MKRKTLCLLLPLIAITCNAQEALFGGTQIESPIINKDGSVTINLFAPKAVKVEVTGDFMPMVKVDTPRGQQEVQASDSRWNANTGSL